MLFLLANADNFLSSKIIDYLPINNEQPRVFCTEMKEVAKICSVLENAFINSR